MKRKLLVNHIPSFSHLVSNKNRIYNNTALTLKRSFHTSHSFQADYKGAGPDHPQRSHWSQRFLQFGFYSSLGLVSILTGAYFYLKSKEKVTYQNFDAHSFRLIHQDPNSGDEYLWTHVHHFQMKSLPMAVSSTMAVIKLNPSSETHREGHDHMESELCLYNVVALTDTVQRELDRLGKVKMIIIPSREHVAFAGQYFAKFILQNSNSSKSEYPVFYCPHDIKESIIENLYGKLKTEFPNLDKHEIVKHVHTLPPDNRSVPPEWPLHWQSQFELQTVSGMPYLTEVVLFHKPTKTLIACDMVMNYKEPVPVHVDDPNHTPFIFRYAKLIGIYGKGPVIPVTFRAMVQDKEKTKQELHRIVHEWDWQSIIVAHGNEMIGKTDADVKFLKDEYLKSAYQNLALNDK